MAAAFEIREVFAVADRSHQRLAAKYAELCGFACSKALETESKLDAEDWSVLAFRLGARGVELAREGDRAKAFGNTFIVEDEADA
jgi:hypothetical protein